MSQSDALAAVLTENVSLQSIRLSSDHSSAYDNLDIIIDRCHSLSSFELFDSQWAGGYISRVFQPLFDKPNIQTVILHNLRLDKSDTLAMARVISSNSTLTRLSLSQSPIDPEAAVILATWLRSNGSLRWLDLTKASLSDSETCQIGRALHQNRTLRTLILRSNSIGRDATHALSSAVLKFNSSLTKLDLCNSDVGHDAQTINNLARIATSRYLQVFCCGGPAHGSDLLALLAASLATSDSLRKLEIQVSNSNEAENVALFATALKRNSSLRTLGFVSENIFERGVGLLATAVAQTQRVSALNFRRNQILSTGAKHLREALVGCRSVTRLDLEGTFLEREGAAQIIHLCEEVPALTSLSLKGNHITGLAELPNFLAKNQTLRSLDLSNNNLGVADARALGEGLCANTVLERLLLKHNNIELSGIEALAVSLAFNSTLSLLDLRLNLRRVDDGKAAMKLFEAKLALTVHL